MVSLGIYCSSDLLMLGRIWLKLRPGEMGKNGKQLLQFIFYNTFLLEQGFFP